MTSLVLMYYDTVLQAEWLHQRWCTFLSSLICITKLPPPHSQKCHFNLYFCLSVWLKPILVQETTNCPELGVRICPMTFIFFLILISSSWWYNCMKNFPCLKESLSCWLISWTFCGRIRTFFRAVVDTQGRNPGTQGFPVSPLLGVIKVNLLP